MWPAQRVIEASRANGDDENETKIDEQGNEAAAVIVVPEQPKLTESERKKIREVHNDYHDRYGYV